MGCSTFKLSPEPRAKTLAGYCIAKLKILTRMTGYDTAASAKPYWSRLVALGADPPSWCRSSAAPLKWRVSPLPRVAAKSPDWPDSGHSAVSAGTSLHAPKETLTASARPSTALRFCHEWLCAAGLDSPLNLAPTIPPARQPWSQARSA